MTPADVFGHCPRCATPRVPGSIPVTCDSCGLVLFLNPAVAAAAFVFDAGGRVLLLRRAHDPARGLLACPGGFLDAGETAEDGVRRETREEVGVELDRIEYVTSCPNLYAYRGVTYPVCDLVFRAVAVNPADARPLDGAAAVEWRELAGVRPGELAFASLRAGLKNLTPRPPLRSGEGEPAGSARS